MKWIELQVERGSVTIREEIIDSVACDEKGLAIVYLTGNNINPVLTTNIYKQLVRELKNKETT